MKKKKMRSVLSLALVFLMAFQSFAGTWLQQSDGTWSYVDETGASVESAWQMTDDGTWYHFDENGTMETGWIKDETGHFYFLTREESSSLGAMVTGWKMIDGVWYFFNTVHDGFYGAALTGWQWIDGYCYCFASDGQMYAGCVTPDGYTVNADGAWTENGTAVYEAGKGIITKDITFESVPSSGSSVSTRSSGGSSSGGSSGGSSSGSSSSVTYSYTVTCLDADSGEILGTYTSSAKKNTTLYFDYAFDGYTFYEGDRAPALTEKGQTFELFYKAEETEEETSSYSYTVYYVDIDSGNILKTVSGTDEAGAVISVAKISIEGYEPAEGINSWTFTLSEDGLSKMIYYQEEEEEEEAPEYYSYTIKYVCGDETLGTYRGTAEAFTTVYVTFMEFSGYEVDDDAVCDFVLSRDNYVITVTYTKETLVESPSEPERVNYTYTLICYDIDTNAVLGTYTGYGEAGSSVSVDYTFEGYFVTQDYEFILDEDALTFKMFFKKEASEEYSYTVYYRDAVTDEILVTVKSSAEKDSEVEIEILDISGYTECDGNSWTFTLSKDGMSVTVYYQEDDRDIYSYVIKFYDYPSLTYLSSVSGTGYAGSTVIPECDFEGCTFYEDYAFTLKFDGEVFTAYLVKDPDYVTYSVVIVDEDTSEILYSYSDIGILSDYITVDYPIAGYTVYSENIFQLTEDNFTFTVSYKPVYGYTFLLIDIDSYESLGEIVITGYQGETAYLDEEDFLIEGYDLLGLPEYVYISSVNNVMNIYYQVTNTYEPEKKLVNYTVEYTSTDSSVQILATTVGTGYYGDYIYIYFPKEITLSDGTIWTAVDNSPRVFTLHNDADNHFTVRYTYSGMVEEEEVESYQYVIQYIANDTGLTLGVSAGYAYPGDMITFRNNFSEYGLNEESGNSFIISDVAEENFIQVIEYRQAYPGPERNEITQLYDSYEWTLIFADEKGNSLLPFLDGRTLVGTPLIIDYPNIIDIGDGYIYEAEYDSPYNQKQTGTAYRQIYIKYYKEDYPENRLAYWESVAQAAADEYYDRTPYRYTVVYQEKDSWNDIALYTGTASKDSYIEIEGMAVSDYYPAEDLGGFYLTEDGQTEYVNYQKYSLGSSSVGYETDYTVNFRDADENDVLFPYSGTISVPTWDGVYYFKVSYPDTFTDSLGNRWRAVESSPQTFEIKRDDARTHEQTVYYEMSYENDFSAFIVETEAEALEAFKEYIVRCSDAEEHTFYLIGKDYDPYDMIPNQLQAVYSVTSYGNAPMDSFELDGCTYYVSKITFAITYDEKTCEHNWTVDYFDSSNCVYTGSETLLCTKCGKSVTVKLPAAGHIDSDLDTVCDNCGKRAFSQSLGNSLYATYTDPMTEEVYEIRFICIDEDYEGSGNMLYIAYTPITSDMYGSYSKAGFANYYYSDARRFMEEIFAPNLGMLSGSLLDFDNGYKVNLLTYEDYTEYSKNTKRYTFPTNISITSTYESGQESEYVTLSDGTTVAMREEGDDLSVDIEEYPINPVILLPAPDTSDISDGIRWQVEDLQAREIGGKIYIFRCVDTDYRDKTDTSKGLALFLCDTVIPSTIIDDGNPENSETYRTLFFGDSNNYKYADVRDWLDENASDSLFSLASVNVGVDTSYSGSTAKGSYENFNVSDLSKKSFSTTQNIYDSVFCLSVEEAINYRDYLWKFNFSDEDNPEVVYSNYSRGYWLRTPETNTEDSIYIVNLEDGTIEPASVCAEEEGQPCFIGIRPAFAVVQGN